MNRCNCWNIPRTYTPKPGAKRYKKHNPALLERAVKAVNDGMSYMDAEEEFKIKLQDQTFRHVKGKIKLLLGQVTKRLSSQEFLRPKLVTNGTLFVKPPAEDIAEFDYDQVVGCTVMPEELRRGVLKFDLNSKKWWTFHQHHYLLNFALGSCHISCNILTGKCPDVEFWWETRQNNN